VHRTDNHCEYVDFRYRPFISLTKRKFTTYRTVVITIVTAEEQLRGRLSVISKASDPKSKTSLSLAYQNLRLTIESLQEFEQIDFDLEAESIYHQLRQQKIRIGTQDLRIASIVLEDVWKV
jgi:predicted nucleic acid-binding protein